MRLAFALVALALFAASCGEEDDAARAAPDGMPAAPQIETTTANSEMTSTGTRIVVRGSEFGRMLFGSNRQAIYVFERDRRGESRCYGACASAWPPVYTRGKPVAGRGVRAGLLGTTRRRNGRRQVTYRGRP